VAAGLIHDPEAEKRSVMLRRKALCNGELTGRACVHYWTHVEKVESNNPDNLRLGEIYRGCTLSPSIVHEMSESQLATFCNHYKPRRKTLLAVIGLEADRGKYDPFFEAYDPLTPEQIKELQKESTPVDLEKVNKQTVGMADSSLSDQNLEDFQDEVKKISAKNALDALDNDDEDQGIFSKGNGEQD
jgi:hypothetical protein